MQFFVEHRKYVIFRYKNDFVVISWLKQYITKEMFLEQTWALHFTSGKVITSQSTSWSSVQFVLSYLKRKWYVNDRLER